jgi:predicted AAA+ superfamily ATPase
MRVPPATLDARVSKADEFFTRADRLLDRLEHLVPPAPGEDFADAIAWRWRKQGGRGALQAIRRFNGVRLADLLHIDRQKEALVRNTRQFLAGLPANNALLWGPRGTGKSSLVKALLNDLAGEGLRLVEVDRLDLVDLPDIVDRLNDGRGRYVIYCDDLSFDDDDATYRALKTVLDGSVLDTPENVVVYATSNRRHLMPEHQADNLGARIIEGELHHAEAVEEKISLSERFGLWLSFHPLNQDRYLDIAMHWLRSFGADLGNPEPVRAAALEWALLHGSRSGRAACQFARDWAGRRALEDRGA